jgi:hypothetical protein
MATSFIRGHMRAFNNAISMGIFDTNPNSRRYVAPYMYMYSDDNYDYFKHMDTREYKKVYWR